jgi:hypothetical protein
MKSAIGLAMFSNIRQLLVGDDTNLEIDFAPDNRDKAV